VLAQLEKDYPEDLHLVYRHYPLLSIHDKAALATQAAEAAGAQGKFWEMHDALFERRDEWATASIADFEIWLLDRAEELGLDVDQFSVDLHSEANTALAQQAWDTGQADGISGTPFMLINDAPYGGPLDYQSLNTIVKLFLLEKQQFTACPEMDIDPSHEYVASIETTKGEIRILLYPEVAPLAVNSFVFLARQGWFDGVSFHRVVDGRLAQTGDPSGTGYGGPGYAFGIEIDPNVTFDRGGLVGMANAGPTSNGSQFFITEGPEPTLDGQFTIFGEVVSGMDIVESLNPHDPQSQAAQLEADEILRVTIEEH
jgi:cyclophilin family peptidyl-prolyl cis-trans isomerase